MESQRGGELGGSRGAPVTSTHWMGPNTTPSCDMDLEDNNLALIPRPQGSKARPQGSNPRPQGSNHILRTFL